jgi:hypothetical protein
MTFGQSPTRDEIDARRRAAIGLQTYTGLGTIIPRSHYVPAVQPVEPIVSTYNPTPRTELLPDMNFTRDDAMREEWLKHPSIDSLTETEFDAELERRLAYKIVPETPLVWTMDGLHNLLAKDAQLVGISTYVAQKNADLLVFQGVDILAHVNSQAKPHSEYERYYNDLCRIFKDFTFYSSFG